MQIYVDSAEIQSIQSFCLSISACVAPNVLVCAHYKWQSIVPAVDRSISMSHCKPTERSVCCQSAVLQNIENVTFMFDCDTSERVYRSASSWNRPKIQNLARKTMQKRLAVRLVLIR